MGGTSCVFPLDNKAFERSLFGRKKIGFAPPHPTRVIIHLNVTVCIMIARTSNLPLLFVWKFWRCSFSHHFLCTRGYHYLPIQGRLETLHCWDQSGHPGMCFQSKLQGRGEENTMDILCVSFARHLSMSVCLWDATGFINHHFITSPSRHMEAERMAKDPSFEWKSVEIKGNYDW